MSDQGRKSTVSNTTRNQDEARAGVSNRINSASGESAAILGAAASEAQLQRELEQARQGASSSVNAASVNAQIGSVILANRDLGNRIEANVADNYEQIEQAFNPGKLWEDFQGLNPWMKGLLYILILGLICLLGYGTWLIISYFWPQILEFIKKNGATIMATAADFLHYLSRSPELSNLMNPLQAMPAIPGQEPPEVNISEETANTQVSCGSAAVLAILRSFFQALSASISRRPATTNTSTQNSNSTAPTSNTVSATNLSGDANIEEIE